MTNVNKILVIEDLVIINDQWCFLSIGSEQRSVTFKWISKTILTDLYRDLFKICALLFHYLLPFLRMLPIHEILSITFFRYSPPFGVVIGDSFYFYQGFFPLHIVVNNPLFHTCDCLFKKWGGFVVLDQRIADGNVAH